MLALNTVEMSALAASSARWSVSADWIRTSLKGRDVNEPVLKRTMTPAESE